MNLRLYSCASILGVLFLLSCSSNDEPKSLDCSNSDLSLDLTLKTNPTNCQANGSITVAAVGGNAGYTYSINGGTFGNSASFNSLTIGTYIIAVKDKNGCEAEIEVTLTDVSNTLAASTSLTPDTQCFGDNGSIQVNASGGASPYQFKIGTGSFTNTSLFSMLAPGTYSITVKDNNGCLFVVAATILKGDTNTSLAADIKPIIDASCATSGCHNGSQSPDLRTNSAIRNNAAKIKSETQAGTMPRGSSLTPQQKAVIACWVDEGAKDN